MDEARGKKGVRNVRRNETLDRKYVESSVLGLCKLQAVELNIY